MHKLSTMHLIVLLLFSLSIYASQNSVPSIISFAEKQAIKQAFCNKLMASPISGTIAQKYIHDF